jgi:hypothetical protein
MLLGSEENWPLSREGLQSANRRSFPLASVLPRISFLAQPIEKQLHLSSSKMIARADDPLRDDTNLRRIPNRSDERSLRELTLRHQRALKGDSQASGGRVNRHMAAIEEHFAPSRRRFDAGQGEPARPLRLRLHRMDKTATRKIGRGEAAGAGIARRANRPELFFRQALEKQSGPSSVAVPYLDVDRFPVEVRRLVRAIQAHLQVGVKINQRAETWQQPFIGKGRCCAPVASVIPSI